MEDGARATVEGFLGDKPSCLHGGLAKVEVGDGLGLFLAEGARCVLPQIFWVESVAHLRWQGVVDQFEDMVSDVPRQGRW